MMNPALVSLCVPSYNNARYLAACLDSALAQHWPNVEVIVFDDGSTDDSLSIAESYGSRIRVLRNEANLGQPEATNRVVRAARGPYVAILHSDDQLLPDFASRLAPLLDAHPSVGLAVGERLETDESGVPHPIAPFYDRECLVPGELQARVFLFSGFLPCQVLMRKAVFEEAGGVDPRHVVNLDGLLWFRCCLRADLAYVREPVGIYRIHSESTTSRYCRNIDHLFEYHGTLREMFRLGRGRAELEASFEAAVRRMGALALRFCRPVLDRGDGELALRYLDLAVAVDPALRSDSTWRAYRSCAESATPRASLQAASALLGPQKRMHSWPPPEGSRPLSQGDVN
jgi:glycosyltransferase involved in cell wall biosynthesis